MERLDLSWQLGRGILPVEKDQQLPGIHLPRVSGLMRGGLYPVSYTHLDDQFEISDGRSVEEVYEDLLHLNLQPVMNDYVYV